MMEWRRPGSPESVPGLAMLRVGAVKTSKNDVCIGEDVH
jgi:hypothetical protein